MLLVLMLPCLLSSADNKALGEMLCLQISELGLMYSVGVYWLAQPMRVSPVSYPPLLLDSVMKRAVEIVYTAKFTLVAGKICS